MRIRKHARNSVLSFSEPSITPCTRATIQTHVCELNRSPWDVMAFAPQSDLSYPDEYQVEKADSGGESVSAFDSFTSLKEEEAEAEEEEEEEEEERKFASLVVVDREKGESKMKLQKRGKSFIYCNKTDGKGWQCRREAKEGHSLCEHHLTQLRSYHHNYSQSGRKSDAVKPVAGTRPRNRNRVSSSATPSDFYYYSGFGPLWGKKRGGGGGVDVKKRGDQAAAAAAAAAQTQTTSSSSSHADHDHDDDDDDDDGDGKKRVRRPVKARSLKSLL